MTDYQALVCSLLGGTKCQRLAVELKRHSFLSGIALRDESAGWNTDVSFLTPFGVNVSAYESLLHNRGPSFAPDLQIVVCNAKIASDFRISEIANSGSYVISCWNMDEEKFAVSCVALIVSCILRARYFRDHSKCFGVCTGNPSIYDAGMPETLCFSCRKELPFNGALESRHLQLILHSSPASGQIVIIQHGIRTYGPWYGPVMKAFESAGIACIGFRYGYFSAPMLFFNRFFAKSITRRFHSVYLETRSRYPSADISVLAHSFGTFLVAEALSQFEDIQLDKVIFVNGIVRQKYSWHDVLKQGRVGRVLNECGGSDILPIIAKKLIPGAGSCGTTGFDVDHDRVINNFVSEARHSSLLSAKECHRLWVPFIVDDGCSYTEFRAAGEPMALPQRLDMIPSVFFVLILAAILVGLLVAPVLLVRYLLGSPVINMLC